MRSCQAAALRRLVQQQRTTTAATATARFLAPAVPTSSSILTTSVHPRWFGTHGGSGGTKAKNRKNNKSGNRSGARGHGWYWKFRQGLGGRHLQGEYFDRPDYHFDKHAWNEAVLSLGSQTVYLDIAVEPAGYVRSGTAKKSNKMATAAAAKETIEIDVSVPKEEGEEAISETENPDEVAATAEPVAESTQEEDKAKKQSRVDDTVPVERLIIHVASTVMPETCINFIGLIQDGAYEDSIIYRMERDVGLCAGDVVTNTGKTGQCWQEWPNYDNQKSPTTTTPSNVKLAKPRPNPLRRDLPPSSEEPMALWHTPGAITMLCPKVNEIDSRFILCGHDAPHLDGMHRAFGIMDKASLELVKNWQKTILTSHGRPKSATLRIVGCGVLGETTSSSVVNDSATTSETAQAAA